MCSRTLQLNENKPGDVVNDLVDLSNGKDSDTYDNLWVSHDDKNYAMVIVISLFTLAYQYDVNIMGSTAPPHLVFGILI